QPAANRLEVGQPELQLEQVDVANRVDRAFDVADIVVGEAAHHHDHGVGLTDLAEELVPQSLAAAGTAHQAGDVGEGHRRGDHPGGTEDLRQPFEPVVGHRYDAGGGPDGGDGIV